MLSEFTQIERATTRLTRSRNRIAGAETLRDIGAIIGMRFPSVIDDYDDTELVRTEDGDALATLFGWESHFHGDWFKHRLHRVSPIAHACRVTSEPFAWDAGEVAAEVSRKRPFAAWHLTPARGVHCGVTVPLHGPHGRCGSVTWMAREPGVDSAAVLVRHGRTLQQAAHVFVELLRATEADVQSAAIAEPRALLSERELECLTWAALGYPDTEIGTLLHRAAATARFHIDNATHKLGARNRTHAVAKAVCLGLIEVRCDARDETRVVPPGLVR